MFQVELTFTTFHTVGYEVVTFVSVMTFSQLIQEGFENVYVA